MSRWQTPAEIAARGVPGLPETRYGLQKWLRARGVACRRRRGRGGGWEYDTAQVPELVTGATVPAAANDGREVVPREARSEAALSAAQRRTATARLVLVQQVEQRVRAGATAGEARAALVAEIEAGTAAPEVAAAARQANARLGERRRGSGRWVSTHSLARWAREAEAGTAAVAPASAARDAAPGWLDAMLALYGQPQKPSLRHCWEKVCERLPAAERPSYAQACRAFRRLGAVQKSRGRLGPRALRARRCFTVRRTDELEPADVYTSDGVTFYAPVPHPTSGTQFRPEIITVIDVATRRVVGWTAGLAESRWLVSTALLRACEAAAVPAIFYADNGRGYRNQHMREEVTGLLPRLGVEPIYSAPYSSQARGIAERIQATLWKRAARELATYVGEDVDEEASKAVYRANKHADERGEPAPYGLHSWDDFLAWAERQVAAYNARPHSALGGESPGEAWARRARDLELEALAPDALADLGRPYVVRRVVRGSVRVNGTVYQDRALEDWSGRDVAVGFDPHDASRVWVRDEPGGRLITTARYDAFRAPYFPPSAIEQAREKRQEARLKRVEARREQIEREEGGRRTLEGRDETRTEADREGLARLQAELEAAPEPVIEAAPAGAELAIPPADASDETFFRAWERVDAALAEGREVPERVRAWHRAFQASPEFVPLAHRYGGGDVLALIERRARRTG